MKKVTLKYNIMLFITAFIWGVGFVFQHQGAIFIGPFLFCAIRYFLGAVAVVVILTVFTILTKTSIIKIFPRHTIVNGIILGFFLFAASAFQQAGLKYTTVSNAGFITEMGIAIVPIIAILMGERPRLNTLSGTVIVIVGLYMLTKPSVSDNYNKGDLLELCGAFLWAVQLLIIDRKAPASNPFALSFMQFIVCSAFSLFFAILFEPLQLSNIKAAGTSLLYAGFMSCGVAFTLQVVAQRKTPAVYTAIILSFEAVFAALAGWLYLDETLHTLAIAGCAVMLFGILLAQAHMIKISLR